MTTFKGFTDSESFTQLPDSFFHHLLNKIEDAAELKVTLYMIWRIEHMENTFRALREADFTLKDVGLSKTGIRSGLEKAVRRGSILKVRDDAEVFYFLNSPRGRATAEAFAKGQWRASSRTSSVLPLDRPNIFKLYEENIGPLTPLIADMLKEAETLYAGELIDEAFMIAVKNNKRNWKYIEAILKRWKLEGKNGQKDKQNTDKGSQKYTDSEFSEFIKRD
ncbi:MAG TPA: DnaD domain protein [Acidobacteriota bacterium]|nr:DnaD domain protein [Acidobacteriota bacterium]